MIATVFNFRILSAGVVATKIRALRTWALPVNFMSVDFIRSLFWLVLRRARALTRILAR